MASYYKKLEKVAKSGDLTISSSPDYSDVVFEVSKLSKMEREDLKASISHVLGKKNHKILMKKGKLIVKLESAKVTKKALKKKTKTSPKVIKKAPSKKTLIANAEKEIDRYFEKNEGKITSDFVFGGFRDMCIDCDEAHIKTHYPVIIFTLFLTITGEDKFFVELTIFKNDKVKLIINEGKSDARYLTAERTLDSNSKWAITFWGDKKTKKELEKFVDEITPLIFVYAKKAKSPNKDRHAKFLKVLEEQPDLIDAILAYADFRSHIQWGDDCGNEDCQAEHRKVNEFDVVFRAIHENVEN